MSLSVLVGGEGVLWIYYGKIFRIVDWALPRVFSSSKEENHRRNNISMGQTDIKALSDPRREARVQENIYLEKWIKALFLEFF